MVTRTDLHRLVDDLPEAEVEEAARFLERLNDPLARLLDQAPADDEPVTDEEAKAIEEGLAAYRRGEYITDDELRTGESFGLAQQRRICVDWTAHLLCDSVRLSR